MHPQSRGKWHDRFFDSFTNIAGLNGEELNTL